MTNLIQSVAIIGPGKVGSALAKQLYQSGQYQIYLAARDANKAQQAAKWIGPECMAKSPNEAAALADLTLLTVSDDAIETVCKDLAHQKAFKEKAIVAHCSGALGSQILQPAQDQNQGYIASIHPLQTFPNIRAALQNLPGTYCFYEGSQEGLSSIHNLIESMHLHPVAIEPEAKTLYHAAAVMACNYFSALMDAALNLGQQAGIDPKILWQGLSPLVTATLNNIDQTSPAAALTGPIARGDSQTIQKHIRAIEPLGVNNPILDIYTSLGQQSVDLAQRKGSITPLQAEVVRALLNSANGEHS